MKERYFFDEQREELVIMTEADGQFDINRLPLVMTFDDEPLEELEEEAVVEEPKEKKVAGRKKGRIIVGKKQREMIEDFLRSGLKTDEIAAKTGFPHEKVNKVASSMYDPSTEEDSGVGL
ncbi:MAG: hypothetical protein HGA33_00875 [Candidatus Moranbacteria bacterium]|nr:hypothetical protein [Candidatus Moranbacteria bacterium]